MDLEVVGIQKILEKLGKDPYLHYTYSDSLEWHHNDVDDYVTKNVWSATYRSGISDVVSNTGKIGKWVVE